MSLKFKTVLAIETSCDDTSVAIVGHDGWVHSVVSANQDLAHAPFGGIVPEIACRNHSIALLPLIQKAMQNASMDWPQIDGIVVTNRPGLIGSLIVGLVTAKSLAHTHCKPLLGVNHLEGHLLAPFLRDNEYAPPVDFTYPYIGLAVSGGHTSLYRIDGLGRYEVLGATLDDAAGEAFDKFAKMLGLEFPGGVKVDQFSTQGNPKAYTLPRSMIHEDNLNMSFSGLKASAQRLVQSLSPEEVIAKRADLCASFQAAVVDVFIAKLDKAIKQTGIKSAIVTGGVSANRALRAAATEWAQKRKIQLVIPPMRYCTDNAAMIGFAGIQRLNLGQQDNLNLGPFPQILAGDFVDQREVQ